MFLLGITCASFAELACKGSSGPDAVAAAFVDAYYIEYDFARALTYADGAAKSRLEEEKKLVDDARQKTELQYAKTHVYYDMPEKRAVGDDLVHYTFHLDIQQGTSKLARTAVVMLARQSGKPRGAADEWRVIAFREEGQPAGERREGG